MKNDDAVSRSEENTEENTFQEAIERLQATISDEIYLQSQVVEQLQKQMIDLQSQVRIPTQKAQYNAKNIGFLRNLAIGLIAALSLASAFDHPIFHGDRIKDIVIALCGAGGLAFLGFRKIEEDE